MTKVNMYQGAVDTLHQAKGVGVLDDKGIEQLTRTLTSPDVSRRDLKKAIELIDGAFARMAADARQLETYDRHDIPYNDPRLDKVSSVLTVLAHARHQLQEAASEAGPGRLQAAVAAAAKGANTVGDKTGVSFIWGRHAGWDY